MLENRKWQFDEKFLKSVIIAGNKFLAREDILESTKEDIRRSIKNCTKLLAVLNNTYEEKDEQKKVSFSIQKTKMLDKMKFDFEFIDPKIMDFVCSLKLINDHFYSSCNKYHGSQRVEEIINKSLDVYNNFAPEMLELAQKIIYNEPCTINFCSDYRMGTQHIYDEFLNMSFIEIERFNNYPAVFIHELEHALERANSSHFGKFYNEVGPITFETLYIDKMCERKEDKAYLLYQERLSHFSTSLDYLASYFKTLQYLSIYNFDVNKSKFLEILNTNNLIIGDRIDTDKLKGDTDEQLLYLISFLKSIEVRNNFHDDKKLGLKMLRELASKPRLYFDDNYLLTAVNLENYQKEIRVKRLNYNHK